MNEMTCFSTLTMHYCIILFEQFERVSKMKCIFCEEQEVIFENKAAFCLFDKNPVNPGH